MNMKDIHSQMLVTGVGPLVATQAADPTVTADLQGFLAAEIIFMIGIGGITFDGTNRIDLTILESDDGVTFSPVTQADILGATVGANGVVRVFNAAKAAASVHRYGYVGGRRFVRAISDFVGTHATGTPAAVTVVAMRAADMPTANQP